MQDVNKIAELCATNLVALDSAMSQKRIDRYLTVANGDRVLALRYYMWNLEICEAFYTPLQFAEIAVRNGVLKALVARYGVNWPFDAGFLGRIQMNPQCHADLLQSIAEERKQHGNAMTHEHIASCVSFSFWDHLCTQGWRTMIWAKGIQTCFPNFPDNTDLIKLQRRVMEVRQWRNRIMHYKTVFDRQPIYRHNEILELLSWSSPEVRDFVRDVSRVSSIMDRRPYALPPPAAA